jgi:hypothetical protein
MKPILLIIKNLYKIIFLCVLTLSFYSCAHLDQRITKFETKPGFENEPLPPPFNIEVQCPDCKGSGWVNKTEIDQETGLNHRYRKQCYKCKGTGFLMTYDWNKYELLKGSRIKITTIPAGALIKIIDTKTREYKDAGSTPVFVDWYYSYVIIEYNGKQVKVMPIDDGTTSLILVEVDFTKEVPIVKRGKQIN